MPDYSREYLNEKEIRWLFQALRKVNFFATATLNTIDKVVARFFKRHYKTGEKIIKEGQVGEAFYIIKSGRCLVYKRSGLFFTKKIAELKEGDFCGEMSLITDNKTSASVKALEPTEVYVLLKTSFVRLIEENKELKQEIEFIVEKRRYEAMKEK